MTGLDREPAGFFCSIYEHSRMFDYEQLILVPLCQFLIGIESTCSQYSKIIYVQRELNEKLKQFVKHISLFVKKHVISKWLL